LSDENKRIIEDLTALIGRENLSDNIYERAAYGQTALLPEMEQDKIPIVVVKPASGEDTAKVVKYADEHTIPITIQGAGTAFIGSSRPKRPGSILLNTQGLTSIEMNEDDMYVEVGAGVNNYDLERFLEERGYMLPANVGSKYSSTIGGAVAINTIGHMVDICLGKLIDYVMGVEAVLPNGELIETGTKSIRRPAGIDYTRFFAGMEGLFGVITKIRLRLLHDFNKAYVISFFPKMTDVARGFMAYYREKLPPPLYGEVVCKEACEGPFRIRGLGEPRGDMALAILIGHTQEDADRQAGEMMRVFKQEGAVETHIVTDLQEQKDYWDSRDNIANILQTPEGEENLVIAGAMEVPVSLSHLADLVEYLQTGHNYEILHECRLFIYGHIGICDLHGMWVCKESWPMQKKIQAMIASRKLSTEIYIKWGCAPGEVGQTGSRIAFVKERYGDAAYSMITRMKKAIDPNNTLNPGNLEGEGYDRRK